MVEELAELSHMSSSHFYSVFKDTVGVAPIEYKLKLLIAEAERLLIRETGMSVGQIADYLGFGSDTYFRRLFRRITGMSPSEYRRHGSGL